MKVLFISRYGSENLGDELIVRNLENLIYSFSDTIFRFSNGLQFFATLDDAFEMNESSSYQTDSNQQKNYMKTIYQNHLRLTTPVSKIRNAMNKKKFVKNSNFENFKKYLMQSDVLIVGGGNFIFDMEEHSESAYYIGEIFKIAKEFNKPIFVISAGIGPFQTNSQLVSTLKVLENAENITVRDKTSYSLIESLNKSTEKVFLTVDPVSLMPKRDAQEKKQVKCIGINVMNLMLGEYTNEEYNNYLDSMEKIITHYSNMNKYKLVIFTTENKDISALENLRRRFIGSQNNIVFENEVSIKNLQRIYSDIDVLIGTRMHSMIISFSQLIPFIGIVWQQKVAGFTEMIGKNNLQIPISSFLLNEDSTINKLDEEILNFKDTSQYFREKKKELEQFNGINKKILLKYKELNS